MRMKPKHEQPHTNPVAGLPINTWVKKTRHSGPVSILGGQETYLAYLHETEWYWFGFSLTEHDTIELRVLVRDSIYQHMTEQDKNACVNQLKALVSEFNRGKALALPIVKHNTLPTIEDVQHPCYIQVGEAQNNELLYANIDYQYYEPISATAAHKNRDLVWAFVSREFETPKIQCSNKDASFCSVKLAISFLQEQLQLPHDLIEDMHKWVNSCYEHVLNIHADLLETLKTDPQKALTTISAFMTTRTDESFILRIIHHMLSSKEYDAAYLLCQAFTKNHSEYLQAKTLAKQALIKNENLYLGIGITQQTRAREQHQAHLLALLAPGVIPASDSKDSLCSQATNKTQHSSASLIEEAYEQNAIVKNTGGRKASTTHTVTAACYQQYGFIPGKIKDNQTTSTTYRQGAKPNTSSQSNH